MIKQFKSADPFAFYCYVEEDGYEWAGDRLVGSGCLGSRIIGRAMPANAFLEFANLEPTREEVRGFAARYGLLFSSYRPEALVVVRDTLEAGSTLKEWAAEIADMRVLVDLWLSIKAKNRQRELKKVITWKDNGVRYSIRTPKARWDAWLATPGSSDAGPFKKGDVLLPARYALQNEINRRLMAPEMATVPRLIWAREFLSEHRERERSRIVFTPPNLLTALWLQFARAVASLDFNVRECRGCRMLFLTGPGSGKRADAKTCGNVCKQRIYDRK
jgi:hypothetical protein